VRFRSRFLFVLAAALAFSCREGNDAAPSVPDPIAAYHGLTLVEIDRRAASVHGRNDLTAIDERADLESSRRNRGPDQVSDDVSAVPLEDRDAELALRQAWRREHVAFSWDNLNPDAQLEPRPERLSLTWLTLAWYLPLARNGQAFSEPWVNDYFSRKRWYRANAVELRLSMVDQVQRETIEQEIDRLTVDQIHAHLASLPLLGMSPEEAVLEQKLGEALLVRRKGAP
jgi:hypothetical protein